MAVPVLIHDNADLRNTMISIWGDVVAAAQNIVDLYDATGLAALTPTEFIQLLKTPDDLLFDKITGGELAIGGVPVIKSKAMEIIATPAGTEALKQAIDQFFVDGASKKFFHDLEKRVTFSRGDIENSLVLDGTNTVQIAAALQAKLDANGKCYATGDETTKIYQFIQNMVADYFALGLDTHFSWNKNPIPGFAMLLKEVRADETFELDWQRIEGERYKG